MVVKQLFQRLVLLTLVISGSVFAKVTELTATIDKNPVLVTESLVLELVANDHVDQGSLDTSALLKDFVVGRTSVSRQTSMVNFDTTQTTRWQTILIPRNPGQFVIPALSVDGVKSDPIRVNVLPASQATQAQHQDVYITTSIDKPTLYLQQQATYTVKLHIAKDLQRGSLTEPQLEQASIRQVGKDKEYSQLVNGKRYRIIERSFAVQPQKSGTFVIQGPVFQGEVVTRSRGSNLFNMFNETKPISRLSPKVSVEVLPIPDGYQGHWLPSEFVSLTEEWQPEQTEYIMGEPITRTVTLTAVGVSEEQLPEIVSDYPSQLKVYPDKSDTATVERDKQLIAQRVDSFAIVPAKVGPAKLPEISIPWFNSTTGKQEFVTLPERRITILPDPDQQSMTAPVVPKPVVEQQPNASQQPLVVSVENPVWRYATFSFAGLWLLTAALWLVSRKRTKQAKDAVQISPIEQTEAMLWKKLQQALKQKNATQVQKVLLAWFICFYQRDWQNLHQACKDTDNLAVLEQVEVLQQSLYGKMHRLER